MVKIVEAVLYVGNSPDQGNGEAFRTVTVTFTPSSKSAEVASASNSAILQLPAGVNGTGGTGSGNGTLNESVTGVGNGWTLWNRAERGGVIAAVVLAGLGLIAMTSVLVWVGRTRGKKKKEMERGVMFGNEERRKKRGKNKGKGKEKSKRRPARGIEGLQNVEMGPAAMRSMYEDWLKSKEEKERVTMSGALQENTGKEINENMSRRGRIMAKGKDVSQIETRAGSKSTRQESFDSLDRHQKAKFDKSQEEEEKVGRSKEESQSGERQTRYQIQGRERIRNEAQERNQSGE